MILTKRLIIALDILFYIHSKTNEGGHLTSHEIANHFQISYSYVKQLMTKASKSGLIHSNVARKGGYTFNEKALQMDLYEIFSSLSMNDYFLYEDDIKVSRQTSRLLKSTKKDLISLLKTMKMKEFF